MNLATFETALAKTIVYTEELVDNTCTCYSPGDIELKFRPVCKQKQVQLEFIWIQFRPLFTDSWEDVHGGSANTWRDN